MVKERLCKNCNRVKIQRKQHFCSNTCKKDYYLQLQIEASKLITYVINCEECNKSIESNSQKRKYCNNCLRKHKKYLNREYKRDYIYEKYLLNLGLITCPRCGNLGKGDLFLRKNTNTGCERNVVVFNHNENGESFRHAINYDPNKQNWKMAIASYNRKNER